MLKATAAAVLTVVMVGAAAAQPESSRECSAVYNEYLIWVSQMRRLDAVNSLNAYNGGEIRRGQPFRPAAVAAANCQAGDIITLPAAYSSQALALCDQGRRVIHVRDQISCFYVGPPARQLPVPPTAPIRRS